MSVEHRGTKALELWTRRVSEGYDGVGITNMTTSWRDGLAFCALIHHFRPDLIDFKSLKAINILENNALAFRIAEQHLGIPALLDAEDMLQTEIPDRLSILTYVSQFYQAFSALGLIGPGGRRSPISPTVANNAKNTSLTTSNSPNKLAPVIVTPRAKTISQPPATLQTKTETGFKTDKVTVGARVRREECVACHKQVFLAERIVVGFPCQLRHRTCFRCDRCAAQLTLASYYETEKGQFCCETCPDEERTLSSGEEDNATGKRFKSDKYEKEESSCDSESDSDSESFSDLEENSSFKEKERSRSSTLPPPPPSPRTIFLHNSLESPRSANNTTPPIKPPRFSFQTTLQQSNFSQLSPAICGNIQNSSRPNLVSDSPVPSSCEDAKVHETCPPGNALDTGQIIHKSIENKEFQQEKEQLPQQETKIENICQRTDIKENVPESKVKHLRNIFEIKNVSDTTKDNISEKTNKPDESWMIDYKTSLNSENTIQVNISKLEEKDSIEPDSVNIDDPKNPESMNGTIDNFEVQDVNDERNVHISEESNTEGNVHICQENSNIESNVDVIPENRNSSLNISQDKSRVSSVHSSQENIYLPNSMLDDVSKKLNDNNPSIISASETNVSDMTSNAIPESSNVAASDSIPSIVMPESSNVITDSYSIPSNVIPESSNVATSYSIPSNVIPESSNVEASYSIPFNVIPESSNVITSDSILANVIPESFTVIADSDNEKSSERFSENNNAKENELRVQKNQDSKLDYPDELNPFGSDGDDDVKEEKQPLSDSVKTRESTLTPSSQSKNKIEAAPFNPFDSDEDEDVEEKKRVEEQKEKETSKKKNLNPFWSDEEESDIESLPSKSKVKPPRPPPPTLKWEKSPGMKKYLIPSHPYDKSPTAYTPPSPSLSARSSSSDQSTLRLRKKLRQAPAPPVSSLFQHKNLSGIGVDEVTDDINDDALTAKMQKDLLNHTNKLKADTAYQNEEQVASALRGGITAPKSERGEWRRKKGPAPARPVPQKRAIRKLPMRQVAQELSDIEVKQTELERQGVLLETSIREKTEGPYRPYSSESTSPEDSISTSSEPDKSYSSINSTCSSYTTVEVEDMILQLFELVNEKNELFRRQTELMYLKREKRLEEEHADLEYQIRCLMLKPPWEKSEEDTTIEEELIARLLKVVEQRDAVVNCLEMERQREAIEDESIATHMIKYQEKHIDGIESGDEKERTMKKKKKLRLIKKKKKGKTKEKVSKIDADKDVDETEVKKKKKNWFKKATLGSSS